MNRPQFDSGKRPFIPSTGIAKRQRNFNIQTETYQQADTEEPPPTIADNQQSIS